MAQPCSAQPGRPRSRARPVRSPAEVVALARGGRPPRRRGRGVGYAERVAVAVDDQRRHAGRAARRPGTAPAGPAGAAGTPAPGRRPRRRSAAVRQATRAPLDRPPTISGGAGVRDRQRRDDRGPGRVEVRRPAPARGGRPPGRAGSPARRATPGGDRGVARPATRSGASTPPPAPWPSDEQLPDRRGPAGVVDLSDPRRPARCRRSPHRASSARLRAVPRPLVSDRRTGLRRHRQRRRSRSVSRQPVARRRPASPFGAATASAPGDQHRPAFARRGAAPDAVAVADLAAPRPGTRPGRRRCRRARPRASAGSLGAGKNVSGSTVLARAARAPGLVDCRVRDGPQQPRVAPCGGDLVRAWHTRPCHPPTSPVGPATNASRDQRPSAPCGHGTTPALCSIALATIRTRVCIEPTTKSADESDYNTVKIRRQIDAVLERRRLGTRRRPTRSISSGPSLRTLPTPAPTGRISMRGQRSRRRRAPAARPASPPPASHVGPPRRAAASAASGRAPAARSPSAARGDDAAGQQPRRVAPHRPEPGERHRLAGAAS